MVIFDACMAKDVFFPKTCMESKLFGRDAIDAVHADSDLVEWISLRILFLLSLKVIDDWTYNWGKYRSGKNAHPPETKRQNLGDLAGGVDHNDPGPFRHEIFNTTVNLPFSKLFSMEGCKRDSQSYKINIWHAAITLSSLVRLQFAPEPTSDLYLQRGSNLIRIAALHASRSLSFLTLMLDYFDCCFNILFCNPMGSWYLGMIRHEFEASVIWTKLSGFVAPFFCRYGIWMVHHVSISTYLHISTPRTVNCTYDYCDSNLCAYIRTEYSKASSRDTRVRCIGKPL